MHHVYPKRYIHTLIEGEHVRVTITYAPMRCSKCRCNNNRIYIFQDHDEREFIDRIGVRFIFHYTLLVLHLSSHAISN